MPLFYRKVLIVPYIVKKDDVYILLFHDRKHQEWTLLSGGCKKGEKPLQSGIRELAEESNSSLTFPQIKTKIHYFRFLTNYKDMIKHKKDVITVYHVYLFPLEEHDIIVLKHNYFKAHFLNDETENIQIFRLTDICFDQTLRIWHFIRDACIDYIKLYFETYITTQIIPPPILHDFNLTKTVQGKKTWYVTS